MAYRIVRLKDSETEYLSLAADWKTTAQDFYADEILEDPAMGLDAHAIAGVLSRDAEDANYHGLVGQYEKLAKICEDKTSLATATLIFEEIVKMGGLIE